MSKENTKQEADITQKPLDEMTPQELFTKELATLTRAVDDLDFLRTASFEGLDSSAKTAVESVTQAVADLKTDIQKATTALTKEVDTASNEAQGKVDELNTLKSTITDDLTRAKTEGVATITQTATKANEGLKATAKTGNDTLTATATKANEGLIQTATEQKDKLLALPTVDGFKDEVVESLQKDGSLSPFRYYKGSKPTVSVNPPKTNVAWVNTKTGEIFTCVDNTPNQNHWVGTSGEKISPEFNCPSEPTNTDLGSIPKGEFTITPTGSTIKNPNDSVAGYEIVAVSENVDILTKNGSKLVLKTKENLKDGEGIWVDIEAYSTAGFTSDVTRFSGHFVVSQIVVDVAKGFKAVPYKSAISSVLTARIIGDDSDSIEGNSTFVADNVVSHTFKSKKGLEASASTAIGTQEWSFKVRKHYKTLNEVVSEPKKYFAEILFDTTCSEGNHKPYPDGIYPTITLYYGYPDIAKLQPIKIGKPGDSTANDNIYVPTTTLWGGTRCPKASWIIDFDTDFEKQIALDMMQIRTNIGKTLIPVGNNQVVDVDVFPQYPIDFSVNLYDFPSMDIYDKEAFPSAKATQVDRITYQKLSIETVPDRDTWLEARQKIITILKRWKSNSHGIPDTKAISDEALRYRQAKDEILNADVDSVQELSMGEGREEI